MRGVHDISAPFSRFRTGPRTVVALALYFTIQMQLTSKASNTSIKISLDIAKRTIHLAIQIAIDNYVFFFLYCACFLLFVFNFEFRVRVFHFLFIFLRNYFAWSLSMNL